MDRPAWPASYCNWLTYTFYDNVILSNVKDSVHNFNLLLKRFTRDTPEQTGKNIFVEFLVQRGMLETELMSIKGLNVMSRKKNITENIILFSEF